MIDSINWFVIIKQEHLKFWSRNTWNFNTEKKVNVKHTVMCLTMLTKMGTVFKKPPLYYPHPLKYNGTSLSRFRWTSGIDSRWMKTLSLAVHFCHNSFMAKFFPSNKNWTPNSIWVQIGQVFLCEKLSPVLLPRETTVNIWMQLSTHYWVNPARNWLYKCPHSWQIWSFPDSRRLPHVKFNFEKLINVI